MAQQANRKLRQEWAAISEFYTSYFVSAGFALCPDHSKCDLSIWSVRTQSICSTAQPEKFSRDR